MVLYIMPYVAYVLSAETGVGRLGSMLAGASPLWQGPPARIGAAVKLASPGLPLAAVAQW